MKICRAEACQAVGANGAVRRPFWANWASVGTGPRQTGASRSSRSIASGSAPAAPLRMVDGALKGRTSAEALLAEVGV